MARNTFEGEWSEGALDDGSVVLEKNEFAVEISSGRAATISTIPTSVRYNPEVNAAKRANISVPPDSRLEGTEYLGGDLKLIIDNEFEVVFDIKRIETSQTNGDDYNIRAFSKGQKLTEIDTEEQVNNEIAYDYLAELTDTYHTIPSEHRDKVNTADEDLFDVIKLGGDVRAVSDSASSGTALYQNVGSDASQLSTMYVKIYAPGTDDVTAQLSSDNGNSYSETYTDSQSSRYGEWKAIDPGSTFDGDTSGYELEFTLNGDSLLMGWRGVENEELQREVVPPTVDTVATGESLYSRSGSELESNTNTSESNLSEIVYSSASNSYRTRQITEWDTNKSGETGVTDDTDASGDGAWVLFDGSLDYSPSFSPEDTFEQWGLWLRRKRRPRIYAFEDFSDWTNNSTEVTSPVYEGSTALHKPDSASETDGFRDVDTTSVVMTFETYIYIPSGGTGSTYEIGMTGNGSGEEVYGRIDKSNSQIEIWDDAGNQLNTASKTVSEDTWLRAYIEIDDGTGTFHLDGQSVSSSLSSSLTLADGGFIRDGEAYFDNMITEMTDGVGNNEAATYEITVDGSTISYETLTVSPHQYEWEKITGYDFTSNWSEDLASADFTISVINGQTSPFQWIDCSVFVHDESSWADSDFDSTLTNNYFNYPHKYGVGSIVFSSYIASSNIGSATTDASIANTNNTVDTWGVVQRVDDGTSFPQEFPNAQSVTDNIPYPGRTHGVKAKLAASGSLRDTDSPREGYKSMDLSDYSVTVDKNDLPILYDHQVSGNNLSSMSQIAGDTAALFRWEGSYVKILPLGDETTSPDLRKEEITSSVSIEDAYDSVQVFGLHNVKSPVLTSADAPSWLDQHKVIRDDSIQTESDAITRARSFLKKNGDVQFSGQIKTLPTFAPVGALMDGSNFNHGQDMVVRSVRYTKNRTNIKLGYVMDVGDEIVNLETGQDKSKGRNTSKGMRIPTGQDQFV